MEEEEAFPEEETTDAPSSRRNKSTTQTTKSRHLAFAFLFGVVFASCFRRWWWYHHPSSRSSPFFFPSSSAHAKAHDGLRVKSRWKKPLGRVNEEDDLDRFEKRGDRGEKEEEKALLRDDDGNFACGWSSSESFSWVSKEHEDVDSLETHELLELSLRSARAAAYLFAKASWPAAMRLKRATFDRGKRVGLWMARFVMHSSSWRGKYYEDEDAAEAQQLPTLSKNKRPV